MEDQGCKCQHKFAMRKYKYLILKYRLIINNIALNYFRTNNRILAFLRIIYLLV